MEKKSNKYVCDMTKGNEVKLLLNFAIPMLIGNIFQQFYNIVDTIIVGKFVGSNALGAVGSVGNFTFFFFALCLGLSSGMGILISQFFGAGDNEGVKRTISNSVFVTVGVGTIMGLIGAVFSRPLLIMLNTPEENFADALIYMRIVCGATCIVAIYNTISSVLRALGDSKTPLIFLIVASVINIVLDLVFVAGFHMGVAGAAWATVIAQSVAAIGSIVFGVKKNPYLHLEKQHFHCDREILKQVFRLGVPIATQNLFISISCIALQSVVNSYGPLVMAAFTTTSRVEQLVHQPFNSLAMAMSTFAGQNAGAGQFDRVNAGTKKSVYIVAVFSLLMIAVMYLFGNPIIGIFTNDPEVVEMGAQALRITSLMYIGLGLIYVLRGMLNGVGDTNFAMGIGFVEVVGRIGFACLLMMIPSVGLWGVWYTTGFTWMLAGGISVLRCIQGKWKKVYTKHAIVK